MKKSRRFLKIATIMATLLSLMLFASCEMQPQPDEQIPGTESTWQFRNMSSYTVVVTPAHKDKITLNRYNGWTYYYADVTWEDWGEDYCKFSYSAYDSNDEKVKVTYNKNNELRRITFIDKQD